MLVYPRLPRSLAQNLIDGVRTSKIPALERRSAVTHPAVTYAATGGSRAPVAKVAELQRLVREQAATHGYPRRTSDSERVAFDRACAISIYREMAIVPADAANGGVWAFLACVVLPDVAAWRFPNLTEERFLGGHRNTFRRLWWRAYTLAGTDDGATDAALLDGLGEDEIVQIMERPTLGGSPRTARFLAAAFLEVATSGTVRRMDLMRESSKRLLRLTPIVSLDALDDQALAAVCDEVVTAARDGLQAG